MQDRLAMKFDLSLDSVQLRLAGVLVIIGAVFVGWGLLQGRGYSRVPQIDQVRVSQAREFIDPNTAGYASLRRLGGVGDVRARAIITYRESFKNPPAFRKPEDLTKVKGIGAGTIRESAHLIKISSK